MRYDYNGVTPSYADTGERSNGRGEDIDYVAALELGDFTVRSAARADSHHDDSHTIHEQFPQTD